jgi:hypothetical protein
MSQPPRQSSPPQPNSHLHGADLASLNLRYVDVADPPDHADGHSQLPSQYVIAKTLLGDPVLCWISPWLAGLFCIALIADYLPESMWRETVLFWSYPAALPPAQPKLPS